MYKYKIELTEDELSFLIVNFPIITNDEKELVNANELHKKFVSAKLHSVSEKKQQATQKATKVRSDKAREKINNAINLLHLENKPITHYSIATTSGVSYNTVKKHIPDIDKIGKL